MFTQKDFEHLQTELLRCKHQLSELPALKRAYKRAEDDLELRTQELSDSQLQLHRLWESNERLKDRLTQEQLGVRDGLQNVFDHIDNKPQTRLEERLVTALRELDQYKVQAESLKQSTKSLLGEKHKLEQLLNRPRVDPEVQTIEDEVEYSEAEVVAAGVNLEQALTKGDTNKVLQISNARDRMLSEAQLQLKELRSEVQSLKRRNAQLALQWQERHSQVTEARAASDDSQAQVSQIQKQLESLRQETSLQLIAERKSQRLILSEKEQLEKHIDALKDALDAAAKNENRLHQIWSEAVNEAEMAQQQSAAAASKVQELEESLLMLRASLTVKEQRINDLHAGNEELKAALGLEVSKRVSKALEVHEQQEDADSSWNLWG